MKKIFVCALLALSLVSSSVSACKITENTDACIQTKTKMPKASKAISSDKNALTSCDNGSTDEGFEEENKPMSITWIKDIPSHKNYIQNIVVDFGKAKNKTQKNNTQANLYEVSEKVESLNSSIKDISINKITQKHEHNWKPIYKTVHHKAVTHQEDQGHYEKEAYDVLVFYDQGVEFDADDKEAARAFGLSILQKIADGELPEDTQCRTRLEERYRKKWVSKMVTVVDKKAYDEKVIVGYKCSCGAKKNK